VDVSFRVRKELSIFGSATNLTNEPQETYIYSANTPAYARHRQYHYFGVQCVVGVKGTY
jgi:hypothetical protein